MLTQTELDDLKDRFGPGDVLASKLLGQYLEQRTFLLQLVDHFDRPGPSPEKTAEHYQLVAKARQLRLTFNP
ncbi:hypothetical protein [Pseudomonas sp. TE50-2]|uniref:hypothetical protein n=1 Tax=Pseudomonas sp. TE50-2 TaxID=3142707 RepID=UPI003467B13A